MPKALQIFVYCLLLVFTFSASVSDAKIFSRKDGSGKTHFTDDPAKIPIRNREGKKDGLRTITEAPPQVSQEPHSESNFPVTRLNFSQEYRIPLVLTDSGNFIVDTTTQVVWFYEDLPKNFRLLE